MVDSDIEFGPRIEEMVRSTLANAPDLLLVTTTAHALAAHRQTKTLPVVMFGSGYPVEAGLAESLARPGRNVTGNATYAGTGIWGKLVELLRDAKPGVKRVGVLWGYLPPLHPQEELSAIEGEFAQTGSGLGVTLYRMDIARADQLPAAFAQMDAMKVEALLVTSGPALLAARQQVLQFAERSRVPTIADLPQFPEDKGLRPLLVYSPSFDVLRRQAIDYVVRILRDGAKPAELPIQRPAKFELVVNLQAAKAIGLTLPQSLLLRADRVIE